MTNELQIFENKQFGQVRAIMKDGEPWFVAADVCKALEVGNPSQALTRLDDDEKFTTIISNEGAASGVSSLAFVNEPGLYTLVLGSRKPEAKSFKRWVTHDVIPSIRKTGAYMTPETIEKVLMNPDTIISLATQIKELQTKVEQDKPKVLFADAVAASQTSILIGDLCQTDTAKRRRGGAKQTVPVAARQWISLLHRRTVQPSDTEINGTETVRGKGNHHQ